MELDELLEWRAKFRKVIGSFPMKKVAFDFAKKLDRPDLKGNQIYTLLRSNNFDEVVHILKEK